MTTAKKILVVDDDRAIRNLVAENLAIRGFLVIMAATGLEALALVEQENPDLILLDLMMPNKDGITTCRHIRRVFQSSTPILVITALTEEGDRQQALDQGANDYLTKPFEITELVTRVKAMLVPAAPPLETESPTVKPSSILHYKELSLDPEQGSLRCRGEPIKLTGTEFALLHYLMQHPGELLPHDRLLAAIWGEAQDRQLEHLRVYIGRLRRKIEVDPAKPEYVKSAYGEGYRFG